MENRNLIKNIALLLMFLFLTGVGFAQDETESKNVIKYLESKVKYSNKLIVKNSVQTVIQSDILEADLSVNIGDPYNDALIIHSYFIKVENDLIPFESRSKVITSSEFIEGMKKKNFKLKTEEDGIAFQSLLCSIDTERPKGFFQIENNWYFIRTKFFDDVSAYEITTDNKASIISVKYHSKLKISIPETILGEGKKVNSNSNNNGVTKKDSIFTHNYLLEKANYAFGSSKVELPINIKKPTVALYHCDLKYTEIFSDGVESSTTYSFMLISNSEENKICRDGKALIQSRLFAEVIRDDYKIKTKDDVKKFQYLLDALSPVSQFEIKHKTSYEKDGIWYFVREKSFDDLYGFMVKADKQGSVDYIDYSSFKDEEILRFRMKDKNFKVDYKFKLISPTKNSIVVKKGESINIQIDFDAKMVNAIGAWILTRFDGKDMGMLASTNMESPFIDEIPAGALENPNHTIEYYLLKSGGTDTEHPLGVVTFEIEVK